MMFDLDLDGFREDLKSRGLSSLTIRSYVGDVEALLNAVPQFSSEHIATYLRDELNTLHRSTVARHLASAISFGEYLVRTRILETNPCRDIKFGGLVDAHRRQTKLSQATDALLGGLL